MYSRNVMHSNKRMISHFDKSFGIGSNSSTHGIHIHAEKVSVTGEYVIIYIYTNGYMTVVLSTVHSICVM